MKRKGLLPVALALALLLPTAGCDSDRLSQFGAFAAAGTAYVTSFHTFTQCAGDAFIAADSATLIAARNIAGPAGVSSQASTYAKSLVEEDTQLRQYLANLRTIDNQAALLGQYFAAITSVTGGKASAATLASIDGLVDSINKINPIVESANFGGKNVKSFLDPAAKLAIAHFEVKALDQSLCNSTPVIQQALALQQAAVKAIAAQMKDSLAVTLQTDESAKVVAPYTANAPLPESWAADRAAWIRESVNLQTADEATAAIAGLRKAFDQLVSDKSAKVDFASLMQSIGQLAGSASAAQAAK